MTCGVPLSGTSHQALAWTRDNEVVPASAITDDSTIRKKQQTVRVDEVGPDDDQAVYLCEMKIAGVFQDRCSITLDVACEFTIIIIIIIVQ